jgi:TPP-dependent pyruvate/acetoin dehydrogenase alpha subunit
MSANPNDDEEAIDMICRQTTYTRAEALEKLENVKDPIKVIQSYLVPREVAKPSRNTHQQIYHEISKLVEATSQQHFRKA